MAHSFKNKRTFPFLLREFIAEGKKILSVLSHPFDTVRSARKKAAEQIVQPGAAPKRIVLEPAPFCSSMPCTLRKNMSGPFVVIVDTDTSGPEAAFFAPSVFEDGSTSGFDEAPFGPQRKIGIRSPVKRPDA